MHRGYSRLTDWSYEIQFFMVECIVYAPFIVHHHHSLHQKCWCKSSSLHSSANNSCLIFYSHTYITIKCCSTWSWPIVNIACNKNSIQWSLFLARASVSVHVPVTHSQPPSVFQLQRQLWSNHLLAAKIILQFLPNINVRTAVRAHLALIWYHDAVSNIKSRTHFGRGHFHIFVSASRCRRVWFTRVLVCVCIPHGSSSATENSDERMAQRLTRKILRKLQET